MQKKSVLAAAVTCLATLGLPATTWAATPNLPRSPSETLAASPANDEDNLFEMLGLSQGSDCPGGEDENEGLLEFLNFGSDRDGSEECESNEAPRENH